ncbi:MAG: hypothetical protein F8N39_11570 [Clostridiaceae bacterium]|nr:hypothetical protein [Clostridiaceae bacterium]
METWLFPEFFGQVRDLQSSPVASWLERQGIPCALTIEAIGGVGRSVAEFSTGDGVGIWQPSEGAGVPVLVFAEWSGPLPPFDPTFPPQQRMMPRLLDTVCWDKSGDVYFSRTGATSVLGEWLIAEALDQGSPLRVFSDPVSWLRGCVRVPFGRWERALPSGVIVLDWRHAWENLGGVSELIADSLELGEQLDRRIRPPRRRRPKVLVDSRAVAA